MRLTASVKKKKNNNKLIIIFTYYYFHSLTRLSNFFQSNSRICLIHSIYTDTLSTWSVLAVPRTKMWKRSIWNTRWISIREVCSTDSSICHLPRTPSLYRIMATSFSDSALIIPVIVSSRVSPHPPLLYKYLQRWLTNQLFSFFRILVVPLPLPLPHIDRNEFDTSRRDPCRSSPNTAKFPQMRGPLTDHHAAIAVARLVSLIRPEKKKEKKRKAKRKKKSCPKHTIISYSVFL